MLPSHWVVSLQQVLMKKITNARGLNKIFLMVLYIRKNGSAVNFLERVTMNYQMTSME